MILILDEPIANLDYRSKFYVIDQINELNNLNTQVLCITHDISMISKYTMNLNVKRIG